MAALLSDEEREHIRRQVAEAGELIAKFWPMRTFAYRNPLHGFEHLPFDRAIREAKELLGVEGYLSNEEYRQLYREGRIVPEGVERALLRDGPRLDGVARIDVGSREVTADEVLRLHLLFGIGRLDATLLAWTLGPGGALRRLQADLPSESERRIRDRARRDATPGSRDPEESFLTELWRGALSARGISFAAADAADAANGEQGAAWVVESDAPAAPTVGLPPHRTISDWLETLTSHSLVESINDQMIKWVAVFVDEGVAGWRMPERDRGFYLSWRELAERDISGRFLGIERFGRKVRELPDAPEDAIAGALRRLGIEQERWVEYLSRQLAQLPGWTGFVRWRGENPGYPAQEEQPIDPGQYLAVRLFYEAELAEALCRRTWGIAGTLPAVTSYWQGRAEEYHALVDPGSSRELDPHTVAVCDDAWRLFRLAQLLELRPADLHELSQASARTLLGWLDAFPEDQHGPVWLEAYEDRYREQTLDRLRAHAGTVPRSDTRPRAQLAFCIDARSEPFRRHVEAAGPYETFGFAGFFGVAISHQAFDTEGRVALCPVILAPAHESTETARPDQPERLQHYASGSRWQELGREMFHHLKANPVASLMLVDVLGLFSAVGLFGKTVTPRAYKWVKSWFGRRFTGVVETEISVARMADAGALTADEQATLVEGGLRGMGLTTNFGRFIVSCGHGSLADNNPYSAALDCGACGGNAGDPNGRVFSTMGNNPEVRRILRDRGLHIPDDTWFLGAKHNTTTDRVTFFDVGDVPESHRGDLHRMSEDLERAGSLQALERCRRIPGAPTTLTPERATRHVERRSVDWANPRPEWGLAGNAGFVIGRRRLTKGLDLGGRVFLQSYDPEADADGSILEGIMMAPLVVGKWISMEYYFSAVDPWSHGSGSKVIHNVVSGIGVMLGAQSDLQTGLPLQTVNDGALHYHEPMRLLAIIEAPRDRIASAIGKHGLLQDLFHNRWVNLLALDPETSQFSRYNADASWESME